MTRRIDCEHENFLTNEESIGICNFCGHSVRNNPHGFDQGDAYMDGDQLVHLGSCTYCKECRAAAPHPKEEK